MKRELTDVFGPTVKPLASRSGAYWTQFRTDKPGYSWWDGKCWWLTASTPRKARKQYLLLREYGGKGNPYTQEKAWRGLTRAPK